MKLAIVIILAAAGLSFYLGSLTRPNAPLAPSESESPSVSALKKSARTGPATVSELLRGRPTKKRQLAVKLAILQMDATELGSLWDSEFANFDLNNGDDREIIAAMLARLGALDPALAVKKLAQTGSWQRLFAASLTRGWAKVDQDAALAWSEEQPTRVRVEAIEGVINALEQDAAVELYIRLVKDERLKSGQWHTRSFFERWVRQDPLAALAAGQRIMAELDNRWPLYGIIEAYGRRDGKAAARWLQSEMDKSGQAYERLISGWAEVDPAAAADFAIELHDHGSFFDVYMLHVLDSWTHADFNAATDWLDGVADADIRRKLQRTLVSRSKNYADQELALDYALRHLDDNPAMFNTLRSLAGEIVHHNGPEGAMAWARESFSDSDQLRTFQESAIAAIRRQGPAESVPFVEALPPDHPERNNHHAVTARAWAWSDVAAAREWVEQLPEGPAKNAAATGLAAGWLNDRDNRPQAAEWIESHFGGPLNDPMADRYARGLMEHKAIEDSIAAAQRIEDPMLRDHTMEDILKVWIRDEIKAEAARAFTESTDLISETARWRVLNRKDGHPQG